MQTFYEVCYLENSMHREHSIKTEKHTTSKQQQNFEPHRVKREQKRRKDGRQRQKKRGQKQQKLLGTVKVHQILKSWPTTSSMGPKTMARNKMLDGLPKESGLQGNLLFMISRLVVFL